MALINGLLADTHYGHMVNNSLHIKTRLGFLFFFLNFLEKDVNSLWGANVKEDDDPVFSFYLNKLCFNCMSTPRSSDEIKSITNLRQTDERETERLNGSKAAVIIISCMLLFNSY